MKKMGVRNSVMRWECTPRRKKRKELGVRNEGERGKYVVGRWEGYIITIGCWYSFWTGLPDFAAATPA